MARRPQPTSDEIGLERAFGSVSGWLTAHVRERREAVGLTQQELAEALGVAPTYVARMESASTPVNLSLRLLVALARALRCRPHELLTPTKPPRPRRVGRPRSPE